MTYVDELAREMHNASCPRGPAFEALSPARAAIYRSEIKRVLAAIAALAERGDRPKMVRREITDDMRSAHETAPHAELQPCFSWSSMFDAAPAVPEDVAE